MLLKLDENLGERGRQMLSDAGHAVATVVEQGLTSAAGTDLIEFCRQRLYDDHFQVCRCPPCPFRKSGGEFFQHELPEAIEVPHPPVEVVARIRQTIWNRDLALGAAETGPLVGRIGENQNRDRCISHCPIHSAS